MLPGSFENVLRERRAKDAGGKRVDAITMLHKAAHQVDSVPRCRRRTKAG